MKDDAKRFPTTVGVVIVVVVALLCFAIGFSVGRWSHAGPLGLFGGGREDHSRTPVFLVNPEPVRVLLDGLELDSSLAQAVAVLERIPGSSWEKQAGQWGVFKVSSAGQDLWLYANWTVERNEEEKMCVLSVTPRVVEADRNPFLTQADADVAARKWRHWLEQLLNGR